jgi:hypothetical protein
MTEEERMTNSQSAAREAGSLPRTLAGAGLLIALLAVSYSLVEAQGAHGLLLAGASLLAFSAGAVELRRQGTERRRHAALELEALESLARESAALPAAARALEEASERVSQLEQRLAESHSEATHETLSVVRSGLLEFQSAMKAGIEDAARVAKEAVTPLVEAAVQNTVAASAASAERLIERVERDMEARRQSEARHFEEFTRASAQLVERIEGQEAAEARQQERAASLLAGIEQAGEALRSMGDEQRESLEASATAGMERVRELGAGLDQTAEAVRRAAELVQAGGAEMTAVAEQFGAAVERQREAADQWLESLGQIESAVDEAGRGAAAEALDRRLAATQEIFATQLEFQRELFQQLREQGERLAGIEAGALDEEVAHHEALEQDEDLAGEERGDEESPEEESGEEESEEEEIAGEGLTETGAHASAGIAGEERDL